MSVKVFIPKKSLIFFKLSSSSQSWVALSCYQLSNFPGWGCCGSLFLLWEDGTAAHREGQWNVVAASHQLLPVPLDLLLLSQLLVVLNQFVNLEGGTGSTVTSAAAFASELAGVPAACFTLFLVPAVLCKPVYLNVLRQNDPSLEWCVLEGSVQFSLCNSATETLFMNLPWMHRVMPCGQL